MKKGKVLAALVAGYVLFFTLLGIYEWNRYGDTPIPNGVLPAVSFNLLPLVAGWAFWACRSSRKRILVPVLCLLLAVAYGWKGAGDFYHRLNYGTFSGKTEASLSRPLVLHDEEGKVCTTADFGEKYLVLFTWPVHSGYFRHIIRESAQAVYREYGQNDAVQMYVVGLDNGDNPLQESFVRYRNDFGSAIPYRVNRDMADFVRTTGINSETENALIIKGNKLVFRGDCERAGRYLEEAVRKAKC